MTTRHDSTHIEKGPSLARGPAWIVGSVLAVFGLVLFFKAPGTPLATSGFPDGAAAGVKFLGFEINAWTAWLTTAAGILVLIGVIQHAIAKLTSLIAGLALGAAAVIALFDGQDVLGLAAANGFTALGWGVAAAILIITALLPRRKREVVVDHDRDHATHTRPTVVDDHRRDDDRVGSDHDRDRDRVGNTDHNQVDHDRTPVAATDHRDRDHDGLPDRVEPVPADDHAATQPRSNTSNVSDETRAYPTQPPAGSEDATRVGAPGDTRTGQTVRVPTRDNR